jgi:hypothetical protein
MFTSVSSTNLFAPSASTPFQRFPTLFLARWFYTHRSPLTPRKPSPPPIKIVCIFDTYNHQPLLPTAAILIHAGDLTISGTLTELEEQIT